VLYLTMATAYNVLQPIGEAPDEPAHLEFVQYIQQHWTLPRNSLDVPAHLDPLAPGIEFDQVPLYYAVLAILLRPVWLPPKAALHRDPFIGWPGHPWQNANLLHRTDEGWPYRQLSLDVHLGRLFSTGLGLVTLLATYRIVARITQPVAALFATAWLGWDPGFLLATSHLNNDAAAIAASSLVILGSVHLVTSRRQTALALIGLSLALGAAILSKVHTLFLVPLVFVAAGYTGPGGRPGLARLLRRLTVAGLVLALPAVLLAAWWLTVGRTYDRRLNVAVGGGVATIGARLNEVDWGRLPAAMWLLNRTWWGGVGAGVETPLLPAIYAALAIPVLVLTGWGIYALTRELTWTHRPADRWTAILLVLSAVPLFYATITRQVFPWVDLDANSRFVLPAAPIIALVVTVGGRQLPLAKARRPLAIGYLLSIYGLAVATAIFFIPRISAPSVPARLASTPLEAVSRPLASFANGVELLSVDNVPATLGDGTALHLTLRWRVARPPGDNFIVFTHVVGVPEEGLISTGHDEIPYQRDFPPILWQTGEIIDQQAELRAIRDLRPGLYTLEVGMYRLQEDKISPIVVTSPSASSESTIVANWKVLPSSTVAENSHPVGARFGEDAVLDREAIQNQANGTRVTLTWRALRSPSRRLVVSVQALDPNGRLVGQHDGEPVDGRLPTPSWAAGDVIEDSHVVRVPSDARVTFIVAMYDRVTAERLPVTLPGKPPDNYVALEP
jgi:hypothetical protein